MVDLFARTAPPYNRDTPVAQRLEVAFIQCLKDGVHPGPTEINERMGRRRINKMNGRDSSLRLQLMWDFGIVYKRGYYKGSRPTQCYIDTTKPFGWRIDEL